MHFVMCVHTKCATIQKKMGILLDDLNLIANRIQEYSDPLDKQIRYELQVQYQILEEETIRLTVSEFRSKYDRNSVSRSEKFKDIKF